MKQSSFTMTNLTNKKGEKMQVLMSVVKWDITTDPGDIKRITRSTILHVLI